MVSLALESESEGSDPDDGADDADTLAGTFEARALFDVAFQISDMAGSVEAQCIARAESGLGNRLSERCAAFVLRRSNFRCQAVQKSKAA